MVGMSKSGSRYGRRSNWFKIHCLMQQAAAHRQHGGGLSFDVPTSAGGGMGPPPSAMSRSVPPSASPPREMKKTELKPTKPPTSLWRPLEPSSPPPDLERPSSINGSFSLVDTSKLQAQSSPPHYIPTSAGHLSSNPHSRPPMMPDLSQLFRLQGCYSIPNSASNQDKDENDDISQFSPLAIAAAAAAANASRFPALYSAAMGNNPLAFLPPTFNIPALSALPLHKQMLLSPLLASSHLWASARKAYPFFPTSTTSPSTTPTTTMTDTENVLAEHKALLERFRSTFSPQQISPFKSPTSASSVVPVDLSDDDSSSMTGETMPHLSDTDEEEEIEENAKENRTKRKDEMPLDLTCA